MIYEYTGRVESYCNAYPTNPNHHLCTCYIDEKAGTIRIIIEDSDSHTEFAWSGDINSEDSWTVHIGQYPREGLVEGKGTLFVEYDEDTHLTLIGSWSEVWTAKSFHGLWQFFLTGIRKVSND